MNITKRITRILSVLIVLSFAGELSAQQCPTTIRVGTSCSCHTCTGTINVVNYTTYVKRVLPQEWLNCWGNQVGGTHSLRAGAVAIRSYTIPRMAAYVNSHGNGLYDICSTTCCHVYGTSQFTNSNLAVDSTEGVVLVANGKIQLSEYAAEQNNHSACGNGKVGNGTAQWPCKDDSPCSGQTYNGHGRGMCQNGSARWATGLNFANSSCNWLAPHGYGTKTWQEILAHYYPNWTLTQCGTSTCPAPVNDNCTGAISLIPASECNFQTFSTDCASQSLAALPNCNGFTLGNADDDVWFKFAAIAGQSYTIQVLNGNNFDGVIDLRESCSGSSLACADQPGTAGETNSVTINSSIHQTSYFRVYHYGAGSGGGSFQVCVSAASPCQTPGAPSNVTAMPIGINSANFSWSAGSPAGTEVTYHWVVGDNPVIKYGDGIAFGKTSGTTASTGVLACASTYYFRVYALTACNNTFSAYATAEAFTTFSADTAVSLVGNTLKANASPATYQWINCSTMANITGATGQTYSPPGSGAYAVRVTQNNCTAVSKCQTWTKATENKLSWELNIFPNPVVHMLHIQARNVSSGQSEIILYNTVGQMVFSQKVMIAADVWGESINTRNLNPGIYMLVIRQGRYSQVFKIQKL